MTDSSETKIYIFHVHGMHCHSCVLLTERELGAIPSIQNVQSSLKDRTVTVNVLCGTSEESIMNECMQKSYHF